jgi:hypothetical protein
MRNRFTAALAVAAVALAGVLMHPEPMVAQGTSGCHETSGFGEYASHAGRQARPAGRL